MCCFERLKNTDNTDVIVLSIPYFTVVSSYSVAPHAIVMSTYGSGNYIFVIGGIQNIADMARLQIASQKNES